MVAEWFKVPKDDGHRFVEYGPVRLRGICRPSSTLDPRPVIWFVWFYSVLSRLGPKLGPGHIGKILMPPPIFGTSNVCIERASFERPRRAFGAR